jgi:processing peptidase subunit beta
MHAVLGNLPDVTIHRSLYIPYKDTALFGNYFMGNEVYAM